MSTKNSKANKEAMVASDIDKSAGRVLERMDDNGIFFEMFRFETLKEAEEKKEDYEARHHKQTYFIRRGSKMVK